MAGIGTLRGVKGNRRRELSGPSQLSRRLSGRVGAGRKNASGERAGRVGAGQTAKMPKLATFVRESLKVWPALGSGERQRWESWLIADEAERRKEGAYAERGRQARSQRWPGSWGKVREAGRLCDRAGKRDGNRGSSQTGQSMGEARLRRHWEGLRLRLGSAPRHPHVELPASAESKVARFVRESSTGLAIFATTSPRTPKFIQIDKKTELIWPQRAPRAQRGGRGESVICPPCLGS